MKKFLSLVLVALVATTGWSFYKLSGTGQELSLQANKFLATLTDDQRAIAALDYDSPARVDWHFIPKDKRKGLQIREMNQQQRQAAHALLKTALSEAGYSKAMQIMEMENLLKTLQAKTGKTTPLRDSERYYFTVFGKPSDAEKWGLSVEGHHLSLSFVIDKGEVISSSPAAFAANPATVMSEVIPSIKKGTQILKNEEQYAFDLLASFTPEQKKQAIIAAKALKEVRAAGEPQPARTSQPEGIAAGSLSPESSKILKALIATYAANWPADVAQERIGAIEKAGFDKVYFAWAGAEKPGIGHYYRVEGPTFQIEFVNTQPDAAGNPANHIHCVWRDVRGDFAIAVQ